MLKGELSTRMNRGNGWKEVEKEEVVGALVGMLDGMKAPSV